MKNFFKSHTFDYIATVMGVVGNIASYIQAYKIFLLQSSYAVSFLAVLISLTSLIIWLIYGISRQIKPLIYANIFGLLGILLIIIGIFFYP